MRQPTEAELVWDTVSVNLRRLRFAVLPVAAAAGLGGLGARRAPLTYAELEKPAWAPPASVFGPVWSVLYVSVAAAGWRLAGTGSRRIKTLHLAQLALNGAWPIMFFEVRDKRASLVVIALLDLALSFEVAEARSQDRLVAQLLMPYLGWSVFATALNAAVSDPTVV